MNEKIKLSLDEIEELLNIIEAQAQGQQVIGIERRSRKAKESLLKLKEELKCE